MPKKNKYEPEFWKKYSVLKINQKVKEYHYFLQLEFMKNSELLRIFESATSQFLEREKRELKDSI